MHLQQITVYIVDTSGMGTGSSDAEAGGGGTSHWLKRPAGASSGSTGWMFVEPAVMTDNIASTLNKSFLIRCLVDGQGHNLSLEQVVMVWSFGDEHLIPRYIRNAMDVLNREKRIENIVHVHNISEFLNNRIACRLRWSHGQQQRQHRRQIRTSHEEGATTASKNHGEAEANAAAAYLG